MGFKTTFDSSCTVRQCEERRKKVPDGSLLVFRV